MKSPILKFSDLVFLRPKYNYKVGLVTAEINDTKTNIYFYWNQTMIDQNHEIETKISKNVISFLHNPFLYKLLIGTDLHYEFNGQEFIKIKDPKMIFGESK